MSASKPKPPRPVLTARAIVLHQGHVLLLRAEEPGRTYFFLPGGGAHHDETLADTAKREVFEETGVRVIVERPLYLREFIAPRHKRLTRDMPPDRHVVGLIFLCRPDPAIHGQFSPAEIGVFPGAADGAEAVTGMEWLALKALGPIEITPPHIKRVLLGDFPPPPERGIEFWPDVD